MIESHVYVKLSFVFGPIIRRGAFSRARPGGRRRRGRGGWSAIVEFGGPLTPRVGFHFGRGLTFSIPRGVL